VGVLVCGLPLTAGAQGVDWQRQVLRVTGLGPPDAKATNPSQARLGAERSAREQAQTQLLEQVKGLPLRADRTVGEELVREETRRQVEGVVRGYQVLSTRYYSDGGVRLEVELPLGALTAVLVAPEAAAPVEKKAPEKKAREEEPTGLVVDARALGMTPVLAPRLVEASTGQVLVGPTLLDARGREGLGVAGFFRTQEQARTSGRVGARPVVIEAAALRGSDLQLGPDAVKALSALAPQVLAEGHVAILTQ
jgi:hypothetical protein